MDELETKSDRRDIKRRQRRKMRMVGRSVKLIQDIIRRRAENLSSRKRE